MKKFVLFLTVVLMGVFPTVSSYAIDEPTFMGFGVDALFSDEKGSSTNSIDKCIIRSSVDTSANDSDECLYLLKDDKKSASQGGSSHLYCNSKWCANNTLVFAKDDVSRGGFGTTNFSGPVLMRCETGLNDSWEKVGGIEALKKCGNKTLKYTINVAGKTVHCKNKENRKGHEYCIGFKTPDDICIEQAEESKQDPKEEEQLANCEEGYEYDPKQGDCVEQYVTEEPKKEEKAPAKKKAAPKAKQKSGKEIFKENCEEEGFFYEDDNTCTLNISDTVYLNELGTAIAKYNKLGSDKCETPQYVTISKNRVWSVKCTVNGFVGTWFINIKNIACREGTFNIETGECDAADSAAAEEPKNTEPAKQTDDDISGLIAKFQKEADEVVDVFKTQAKKIKANQQ